MKIIKQGRDLSVVRFTCYECKCIFEAEKAEYFVDEEAGVAKCDCPNCGNNCLVRLETW